MKFERKVYPVEIEEADEQLMKAWRHNYRVEEAEERWMEAWNKYKKGQLKAKS